MLEQITIDGQTAIFFPFGVNWSSAATETLQYKTEIFAAYAGKEQRRALRSTPRRSWSFSTMAKGAGFRTFVEAVTAWQGNLFVIPEPSRESRSLREMVPFATSMEMVAAKDWHKVGSYVVLRYRDEYALRKIDRVIGKVVRFDTSDGRTWPQGTYMYPAMIGRFDTDQAFRALTSRVLTATIDFDLEPLLQPYIQRGLPEVRFDGVEVFTKKPNWARPVSVGIESTAETLDFGRGRKITARPIPYNIRTQEMTFLNRSGEDADYAVGLFARAKGRRGVFYAPTWTDDFRPNQSLAGGSKGFYSDSESLFGLLYPSKIFRKIALITRGGFYHFNEIVGAQTAFGGWGKDWGLDYGGSGNTRIALREPWPRDFHPDEIAALCWMPLCRFASDNLSLTWHTDSVSEFKMSVVSLEDPYPLGPVDYDAGWGINYGQEYGGLA